MALKFAAVSALLIASPLMAQSNFTNLFKPIGWASPQDGRWESPYSIRVAAASGLP